jgi:RNA polymerase sigma factor (sigma-70 family)
MKTRRLPGCKRGSNPVVPGLNNPVGSALLVVGLERRRMDEDDWRARCVAAYPQVYRAMIAMGASPSEAGDAVQDAYEKALRQGRPLERPEGWLFVVAVRRFRADRWRRRIFRPLSSARRSGPDTARPERVDLLAAVAALPPRQREVLIARYVMGLSQAETARLLHIAPGTVAATTSHATKSLRERLGEGYGR